MKSGLFPVSRIQLTSRHAGAGRDHSWTQSLSGQWNIPYHRHHTQFVMGVGWGEEAIGSFCFPLVQILSCPGVWTFLGVRVFLRVLQNFQKLVSLVFHDCCSGTGCRSVIVW